MTTQPPYHAQQGFTLIELLIAMTLAAAVVALGADILRTGMDFYHRAHNHFRQQQDLHGLQRLLRVELPKGEKKAGILGGQPDGLEFTTTNLPQGTGWPGKHHVLLICRADQQGGFELVHSILLTPAAIAQKAAWERIRAGLPDPERPAAGGEAGAQVQPEEEVLVSRLANCAFSFLVRTPKSSPPRAAWTDHWPVGEGQLLAIRIHLALPSGNLPALMIPL